MNLKADTGGAFAKACQLGDLLDFRNEIVHPKDRPAGSSIFVGLEHIERDTGVRIGAVRIDLSELTGRRARFYAGDIVYGYLRPYLNKVWIAEFDGICSVDQYVFIVRPEVDREYIARFLRSDQFLKTAPIDSTPGQLPRIRSGEIAATPIALPTLAEQRRIAAILEEADDLRLNHRRALKLLDDLAQSIFVEMFGEMVDRGDVRYPVACFAELLSSQKIGLVRAASELSEDAPVPYLRMDAIALDGQLDLEGTRRTHASEFEISEYALKPGDFLFNTRNSRELVGKAAVFDGPDGYIYNNNILRVRFAERLRPEYASAFFRTRLARSELELRKSGTTSVYAIYQKNLDTMPIVVPPTKDQAKFAEMISQIKKQKAHLRDAERRSRQLFSSLQHRAFSGQL
ncbi:restriction endonuclease subunit S [Bradyrhizobium genomosp. III]|uniref:restriction endonuclease subunit S n=1 Tax=Bradyrhizobium genomosp. III TaxID=2683271 RepID=UPI000674A9B8|nr:restriction endonuclease subunit S [Bradyrhizobium sp. CCBAU 15544]